MEGGALMLRSLPTGWRELRPSHVPISGRHEGGEYYDKVHVHFDGLAKEREWNVYKIWTEY